jgi:capsular exopolysaccharide synthesis family protein
MNRVSEAIRRAAAEAQEPNGKSSGLETLEQLAIDDIATLAREAYPIELTEHRRPRPASAPPAAITAEREVEAEAPAPSKPAPLIERIDGRLREKVVVDTAMNAGSREQYRKLAATLHHAQTATGLKVVMIASATVGEGKTLTAANLALTFSESYQRSVLLIDADLRRPSAHVVFGIEPAPGLTEGLAATDDRKVRAVYVSERLAVLPAGRPSSDPMAGLTSQRMQRIVTEAKEIFDWVIVDTPPVTLLPDANLLAAMVDGAVLVVKAESTQYNLVNRAVEAIGRDRILGVVLNQATTAAHGYGYDDYYYYYSASHQ